MTVVSGDRAALGDDRTALGDEGAAPGHDHGPAGDDRALLRRRRLAQVLLFVTPAFWSMNYIGARAAVGHIDGHQLALGRWTLALLVMLPFAWSELRDRWPQWRAELPQMLVLGALGMWICGAFVYIGAQTTTAVNIGLLYALAPVLIAVLSVRLLGERLHVAQVAGATVAIAGVLVVLFKGSWANALAIRLTAGDLWVGVAVLSWVAYSVLLKGRTSALGPFARLTAITAVGVVVLVPLTAIEIALVGLMRPSWTVAGLVVLVALLPGVGAYQSYSFVQRELGAARTGLILYLGPVYAALVAWALLGERPQWFHGLGTALILPGIWLATRRPADRTAA
jgi:drug/metabolite transporter (DMT)-like permease